MKKSNFDPEDILKDITSAVDLISRVENIDFNKTNINILNIKN